MLQERSRAICSCALANFLQETQTVKSLKVSRQCSPVAKETESFVSLWTCEISCRRSTRWLSLYFFSRPRVHVAEQTQDIVFNALLHVYQGFRTATSINSFCASYVSVAEGKQGCLLRCNCACLAGIQELYIFVLLCALYVSVAVEVQVFLSRCTLACFMMSNSSSSLYSTLGTKTFSSL